MEKRVFRMQWNKKIESNNFLFLYDFKICQSLRNIPFVLLSVKIWVSGGAGGGERKRGLKEEGEKEEGEGGKGERKKRGGMHL